MGLRNAAHSLQRIMDHILRDSSFAKCYLDDIFVVSGDHNQNNQHLRQLLTILVRAMLQINPDKCVLGRHEEEDLGHSVLTEGIKPPTRNVQAIEWFLKLLKFYCPCIPKVVVILAPLNKLFKGFPTKGKKFRLA